MDYDDNDDPQRQGRALSQPSVRKHLTIFNSIYRSYDNILHAPNFREEKILQPHFYYMQYMQMPHRNKSHPADGICAHFLLHAYNRLQKSPVNVGCWSSEARRLVLGTQSGEFTLWEGDTFKFERLISTHTPHAVRAMTWSNNGTMLISGDHSGVIKYFNASITFVNSISEAHSNAVRGLSFSPTDAKFASCSDDGTVRIWDWETSTAEKILTDHLSDVKCLAWHPYRSLVVSGSKDNTIKLWDPRQAQAIRSSDCTLHSHKNTILSCGWSINGNWLATGSRDQLVKLFDLRAMREMETYRGHNKEVCSLAWHPQHEEVLLSGGFNGTLIFWMVGHQGPHTVITNAHNYSVNTIAWHPIGHCVASASNDGIVKFWSREPPGSKCEPEVGEWGDQLSTLHGPLQYVPGNIASETPQQIERKLFAQRNTTKFTNNNTTAFKPVTSAVPSYSFSPTPQTPQTNQSSRPPPPPSTASSPNIYGPFNSTANNSTSTVDYINGQFKYNKPPSRDNGMVTTSNAGTTINNSNTGSNNNYYTKNGVVPGQRIFMNNQNYARTEYNATSATPAAGNREGHNALGSATNMGGSYGPSIDNSNSSTFASSSGRKRSRFHE